jgi:hypothetical protein
VAARQIGEGIMRSFKKIIGKILLSALLSAAFMVGGNADAEE